MIRELSVVTLLLCSHFLLGQEGSQDSLVPKTPVLIQEFYAPVSFSEYQGSEIKLPLKVKADLDFLLNTGGSFVNEVSPVYSGYVNAGVVLKSRNKTLSLDYSLASLGLGNYMSEFVDSTGVLSGFGVVTQEKFGYLANRIRGRFNWQISKHFNTEIGNHTNFWGNGYRSMVLGENTTPYPYLKLTTKVWKIKYTNLFMQLRDLQPNVSWKDSRQKYVALHAIDFKVNERFSFTVFESVVWQSSDTLSNRNFDINYLNPVIFYRPVEFSQGSADNVLLGIAARISLDKKFMCYGQLFLDEFLLSEVKKREGWWANKVGIQIGVQAANLLPGFWAYSEFNSARPFTYTHGSVLQNYGHRNQSLAHPLGTNFYEWSSGAELERNNWVFTGRFNWALYGRDLNGDNYGGDIFRSYKQPFRVYDNKIGQGNTHHSYITQLTASRKILKNRDVFFFGSYNWRHVQNQFELNDEHIFSFGISSSVYKISAKNSNGALPNLSNDF